jgi:hypothetical protein
MSLVPLASSSSTSSSALPKKAIKGPFVYDKASTSTTTIEKQEQDT